MRLLDRLERRFRPWAIPHLTLGIILGQVFLYVLNLTQINPGLVENATLYPDRVLQGEVWRLISFIFVPPGVNPFFAFFCFYFFYLMGSVLEAQWGTVRYNFFLLIGTVATIAAAFLANQFIPGIPVDNWFIYGTIFLAFATLYPDFVIYIMLILPIKVKWIAILTWIMYFFQFVYGDWTAKLLIFASLLNYFCFFGGPIYRSARYGHRRMAENARRIKRERTPRHICRVCGVTNLSDPKMRFRYCSMCEGQCGYCSEHIHDHEHVIEGAAQHRR